MGVIVADAMTEATTVALTAHVPNTGTGWVEVANTSARIQQVVGGAGYALSSGTATGTHQLYRATPSPSGRVVNVKTVLRVVDTGTANRPVGIYACGTGSTDFYAACIYPSGRTGSPNGAALIR